MMRKIFILTSFLCGLFYSCSSLQTGLVSDSARVSNMQLPYYLPRGLITIDVLYKPKTHKVTIVTESSGPSGPKKVTETKEEAVPGEKELIPVLTSSLTYMADKAGPRLYAQYSSNIFSKDIIDIKTDEEGLLTTAEGQSEDKSLVVVENLALAALEAVKFLALPLARAPEAFIEEIKKPEEIHITIDPSDKDQLEEANRLLSRSGLDLREMLNSQDIGTSGYKAVTISFEGDGKYSGLLFRPLKFYRLYQGGVGGKGGKLVASFGVPDPTQHFCVPLKRRAFVASKTKLEIEKGILKGFHMEKGSEAEAISGLPLRLVKEFLSLPKGILIYQSDQIKAETGLIEAQTGQIKALQNLEKTRQGAQ